MSMVHRFLADERGATAIEYGLILALIFLVIVGTVTAFASKATAIFDRVNAAVAAAIG